ncbi:conjugal transfer protein TraB [Loktanella sp. IMCC34160]|uniref:TrbI/VirB10 family protein n=1 Tax=Loktanella sp. IMCC34160 TaxID=2510646 RepID=UPI00101C6529|nr:TrbI/VirB10 family protein [Loktanella sp. IMCC34160]RYG89919.1 conjugal transfer protein TraB [Loktanella sp. IMCC34160]
MALDRKSQQYAVLALGGVSLVVVGYVIFGVLGPDQQQASAFPRGQETIDVSIVADRTSAAAPEMSWVTQSRAEIENMKTLIEDLQESLAAEQAQGARQIAVLREEYDEIIVQQATKIAALERPAGGGDGQASVTPAATGGVQPNYADTGSEFIERRTNGRVVATPPGPLGNGRRQTVEGGTAQASTTVAQIDRFGQSFALAASAEEEAPARNTLRNYIPAGSYAPAVVLSGADAATNVVDRENPIPVLFRITGPAVTAAAGGRRGARVNIEGCTVQGSAIGDLSSERVRVRLLSLTCLKRNGEIVETQIAGYMVGAGKEGVRGQVVSREGPLVTNAAIAGALQGLATAAQPETDSDTDTVEEIARNAAAAAGAGGIETAASTLSEYYINRAEQYQPVISLNGGTRVELVFLEGVSLQ